MERIWKWLDHLFWKRLACKVDAQPQWFWHRWYVVTGAIAAFCHRQHCENCARKHWADRVAKQIVRLREMDRKREAARRLS